MPENPPLFNKIYVGCSAPLIFARAHKESTLCHASYVGRRCRRPGTRRRARSHHRRHRRCDGQNDDDRCHIKSKPEAKCCAPRRTIELTKRRSAAAYTNKNITLISIDRRRVYIYMYRAASRRLLCARFFVRAGNRVLVHRRRLRAVLA